MARHLSGTEMESGGGEEATVAPFIMFPPRLHPFSPADWIPEHHLKSTAVLNEHGVTGKLFDPKKPPPKNSRGDSVHFSRPRSAAVLNIVGAPLLFFQALVKTSTFVMNLNSRSFTLQICEKIANCFLFIQNFRTKSSGMYNSMYNSFIPNCKDNKSEAYIYWIF